MSERYFYGDFTAPGATYDPFRASRAPGTVRLFVQGGSTALGFPYFYGAAFPRMLEWRLQQTFPDRDVEVVNTALTAVNSHTLLDFADEIIEQEPDAVLIYAGHNEYYGAFGVASSRAGGNTRWVAAYLRLRRLRLVQLMSRALSWLTRARSPHEDPRGSTVMARMVGERTIPLGSKLYRAGLDQFERNLDALLGRYARAGIPVYIATVVSNERGQPPFISEPDPSVSPEEWDRALGAARGALAKQDPRTAWAAVADLRARDRRNADAFFRAARLFDSAGAHHLARELYRAAKERDLLRFRAPEAINRLVRKEASEHEAVVVDVERAFVEAAPDSIVDESLITEHLHPTIDGYFLMADAFYEALRENGAIGSWEHAPSREDARGGVPVTAVDSLYGSFLLRSLTAGWPFQDDPEVERRTREELRSRRGADPVEEIALALFRRQTSWPDAMLALYDHDRSSGLSERAEHVARALAQEQPLSSVPLQLLAQLALDADSLERAEKWLGRAWSVEPTVEVAMLTGSLLLRQGRHDEAVEAFERGVRVAPPDDSGPRAILAAARSLPDLERKARDTPRDADILYRLALAYTATNLRARARATVARLLEVEPGSGRGRWLLTRLEASTGDPPSS
ncbi:MAG TPA: tetratricopeptide repeat protein [Longimicrobiales bacterium]|nr:tetratricopeptide repeat protein [Longimicrobiales bacterium]